MAGWTGVNERTFIAVKPDGVQRRLVGEIIRRFERKGFKLVGMKFLQVRVQLITRKAMCNIDMAFILTRLPVEHDICNKYVHVCV